MKYLLIFMLAGVMLACGETANTEATAEAETEAVAPGKVETETNGKTFGATFEPEAVVAFASLENQITEADSTIVTVRGMVDEVCQKKGCWMTIVKEGEEEGMMVRFKDYGFFMPKDISGREVVMHGKAFYEVTPIEELRHYAEDAGKSVEEIAMITEPKRELKFLADGVILMD